MSPQQQIEYYKSVAELNDETYCVPDHNGVYGLGILEHQDVADDINHIGEK